ncbi:MAG: cytochrome c [Bacteroidales bacterium]|jgi:nitric oxide reductase subunit C|nr:cytochrome c [Bacteroidales bacterium]MCK9448646.1 cytochrome c [Bacteroidales bacterium]MDD3702183.1 cytochrome c [Bacteroidales bacterium]MDY0368943.1 cytochrome c [Bacteroidales bacterium]
MLSKSQARTFFLGGTFITFAIFLGLTWNSLVNEVPEQTNVHNLTEAVVRGKTLWEENNCMGCHTIFGEGAYYAPELTKVYERRGEAYIKATLMTDIPWAPRGRKMVAYGFSEDKANDLVEFFKWVNEVDLIGFPPKPKKVQ